MKNLQKHTDYWLYFWFCLCHFDDIFLFKICFKIRTL